MEALYFRYREFVYSQAYRFCRNRDDALDVMQETFFYLFRKFPGFELTCRMKTFLYPVVKNLSLARIRKSKRSVPLGDEQERVADPAGPVDRHEPLEEFSEVLSRLSEEHRTVVVLRFAEDMSLSEIAEALDTPLGTVKSRLHNATLKLRELLP